MLKQTANFQLFLCLFLRAEYYKIASSSRTKLLSENTIFFTCSSQNADLSQIAGALFFLTFDKTINSI